MRALIADKIPPDLVVARHTENAHWYEHTPSGVLLPSATGISGLLDSPHLKKWAAQVAIDHIDERLLTMSFEPGKVIQLGPDLRRSAVMAHEDLFHEAGDIGTQGHDVIERYTKAWLETGAKPDDITSFIGGTDSRLWAITRSAVKFMDAYMAIPVAAELKVAYVPARNPNLGFAGTLDNLSMIAFPTKEGRAMQLPNMPKHEHEVASVGASWWKLECMSCGARWEYHYTLVDWKTSNSIRNKSEYVMQTSAYWKAIRQMTGVAPSRIVIVRLDKYQEKYEVLEVINPSRAFSSFQHLRNVYEFLRIPESQKTVDIERNDTIDLSQL